MKREIYLSLLIPIRDRWGETRGLNEMLQIYTVDDSTYFRQDSYHEKEFLNSSLTLSNQ